MRYAPVLVLVALWVMAAWACTQAKPTGTLAPTSMSTATSVATLTPPATHAPDATPSPTAPSTLTPAPTTPPLPTPAPTREASPLAPLFSRILERTAGIRGLEPLEEVNTALMTREELASSLREDLEEKREEVLKSQALLKLLDLIPQDADLYQMLLDLYSEQVVGFYDTETRELYIIKDMEEITPLDEISLAHEYTHALQQQHFDIDTLSKGVEEDSEAGAALDALIEGDATSVQLEYMSTYLTHEQLREVYDASGDSPVFDGSPYFLQQSLLFPYDAGLSFVRAILLDGQWDAVSDAYGSPPLSTEQVLHPDKYLQGERPRAVALPDVAAALGQGWREVYGDVMGEFSLRTYLETLTREDVVARAAVGWGGDRFTLMEGPRGEQALAVLLSWDSDGDAREFFDVLDSSGRVPQEGYLSIRGDRVLWVLSPTQALTARIRAQFAGF